MNDISLEAVKFPKHTKNIGGCIFKGCENLKSIELPEGIENIDQRFISGTKIRQLTIPSTIENGDLWYPKGLGIIDGALYLKEIQFVDGVHTIPDYFCSYENENDSLKKVIIPESVTSIGDNTFYNCKNITIYGYSGSYAETYAVAHNIPFESLGDVIGSHEYDYSSTLDQWLLDKGTSNSMNYLIHGDLSLIHISEPTRH
mgnify:FL=1